MEPRHVLLLARILDPRRWRARMRQVGSGMAAVTWIWFRAVGRAEVVRANRDLRWQARRTAIRADTARREARSGASRR